MNYYFLRLKPWLITMTNIITHWLNILNTKKILKPHKFLFEIFSDENFPKGKNDSFEVMLKTRI